MTPWLLLFAGGGLGAVARGALAAFVQIRAAGPFPWGILAVNLIGCLAIGLLVPLPEIRDPLGPQLRMFWITGVLGGFTTYSAFGLDTWRMIAAGDLALAGLYAGASVVGGVAAVALGARIAAAV